MTPTMLVGLLIVALTAAASYGRAIIEIFGGGILAWMVIDDHALIAGLPTSSAVPWTRPTVQGIFIRNAPTPSVSSCNHPCQRDISQI
jgi:hypothetical protein